MPKSRSRRRRSRTPITPVTRKVCGPRRSRHFPNVYKRKTLVKMALKSEDFNKKAKATISTMTKDQLCSRLELKLPEDVQDFRIIGQKYCGPNNDVHDPDIWSVKELRQYAIDNGLITPDELKKMNRMRKLELCVFIGDRHRKRRLQGREFVIPNVPDEFISKSEYRGREEYITPIMLHLMLKHPDDLCMYIPDKYTLGFYAGIQFDCNSAILINDDLLSKMKACSKRFFVCLIRLTKQDSLVSHINSFIYDKANKNIYMFEPLGRTYSGCNKKPLNDALESLFKKEIGDNVVLHRAKNVCPAIGIQKYSSSQYNWAGMGYKSEQSFCAIWTLFMIDMILTYPDMDYQTLLIQSIKAVANEERGAQNYIRAYAKSIEDLRLRTVQDAEKQKIPYGEYMYHLLRDINM